MSATKSRKRIFVIGGTWVVSTILAEIAVAQIDWHPFAASREAKITDDAFDLLMVMSAPVATFVLVMMAYSIIADRDRGEGTDGPPIRTNGPFIGAWVVATSALAIVVIITPGFTGLDELRAEPEPDIIIDVRAERWSWAYTYTESGVETQGTLMLPVDQRVLFRMTATDVIHSFWIPAFRIKQDVVPGKVTETLVTPDRLGSFDNADEMRVQCAELCGVGHARMWTGVEVVTQEEFDAWIEGSGG